MADQDCVSDPSAPSVSPVPRTGWLVLALAFLKLGATAFGGMWGATRQIEQEFSERRNWISKDELPFMLVAATLIPAPKFMGLVGLIGYRMRGWLGSALASSSLVLPGAIMVVAAVVLIPPETLSSHLGPVQRSVGIAVAGITCGAACKQIKQAGVRGRNGWIGIAFTLTITVAMALGVPVLAAATAGLTLGAFLIKEA